MEMTPYQQYIFRSRYARWLDEKGRRETWEETVDRYVSFYENRIPEGVRFETVGDIRKAILTLSVMPSMRGLMTAGKALERDNVAGYNCAYVAVDSPRAFDEAMYILMCGTGVGYSVERQYIQQLPVVAEDFYETETVLTVRDSRIGWAAALKELISLLYGGMIPTWNLKRLRLAGAPLKTFGGRASGPEPLDDLFHFAVALFKEACGRKLTSLECHDLMCKIADVVVSGGVRRSAMISLSNLSDDRMRGAKNGQWWVENGQRALANNSAVYTEKPDIGIFMKEWMSLYDSKSGERGIFNRQAATLQAKKGERRKWEGVEFGVNPCAEIVLRSKQFCNLSEVVVRPDDTEEQLMGKVEIATIMGTLQSTVTDFRYLRKDWKENCEEERLLGISLTGIMDNKITKTASSTLATLLAKLKAHAIEVNKVWAEMLGIKPSAAITCIKPSGTVSQLVWSGSGIHPWFSEFILRAVRNDRKDPIGALLKSCGVRNEPDVTKPNDVDIFYFPVRSPVSSTQRKQVTAIQQLELYLMYRTYWCDHNPSTTIYVRQAEWLQVAAWVYEHFDDVCGVSFLPYVASDHVYKQAPYSEITEEQYKKEVEKFPKINWEDLGEFERTDQTLASHELACSAGQCELV